MDYELSRAIERMAAMESEIAALRPEVEKWQRAFAVQSRKLQDALTHVKDLRIGRARIEGVIATVNAIVEHQNDERRHPLTCGNSSGHALLFPFVRHGEVILRCRDCDYVQTHIPSFLCATVEDDTDAGAPVIDETDMDSGC